MKFSILMPVHTADHRDIWMRDAIGKILKQSHKQWEVVLSDDCSGDYLPGAYWALPKHSVTLVADSKADTTSKNANLAARNASGDVFYFHATDDLLFDGSVLGRVAEVMPLDRPAWVIGRQVHMDEAGRPIPNPWGRWGEHGVTYKDQLDGNYISSACVFWNRKMWNAAGSFNESYQRAWDYDQWMRFWRIAEPIWLDYPVARNRHHPGQQSVWDREAMLEEAQAIIARYRKLASVPQVVNMAWSSRITTLERLAMQSHLAQGHKVRLYSYNPGICVPAGVEIRDASKIMPESEVFTVDGEQGPAYCMFRWKLFAYGDGSHKEGEPMWWSDCDCVALRPWQLDTPYVFVDELIEPWRRDITNWAFKMPMGCALAKWLAFESGRIKRDEEYGWMTLGPNLLRQGIDKFGLRKFVQPPVAFAPIMWIDHRRIFEPHSIVPDVSYAVHLFHSLWGGRVKEFFPDPIDPEGAYPKECLWEKLKSRYLNLLDNSMSDIVRVR